MNLASAILPPVSAAPAATVQSTVESRRNGLDRFLREVEKRALRMAEMATRNIDDALELTQEAMLGFVRNYAQKPENEWKPLFYTVLDSRIQDFHRRNQVRSKLFGLFRRDPENDDLDPMAQVADLDQIAPLELLAGSEAGRALESALRGLPGRQRQAFLLRIWEGFDVAQTAKVMACSEGSVKTHLFRALGSLRKQLEEHR